MSRPSIRGREELPTRFSVADLSVRDCVELVAGLASYARKTGLTHVEVTGPSMIGDLIDEFGFDEVHFVEAHEESAVDIAAAPQTWRCGQRGLRCLSDQLVDTVGALSHEGTPPSTLLDGAMMLFTVHNRLGDALSIVTGLEHYCRDNGVASVVVTGSHALAGVVETFACERVSYVASTCEAISGDAIFARSSWSLPWLDRFNHAVTDAHGGRAHYRIPPLPLREEPAPGAQEDVVYCQFDARSTTPPPRDLARRLLRQVSAHGDVRVLGGPDTAEYLGPGLTYVRADLVEMVARLRSCRLFVGCDSGLGHLAGCLGVPGLIIATDDFETTWSFFRGYASLSVIPLAATELLLQ
ncbi:glycosyltransferase family 9 protein [Streptomyces sp. B6B3]|uniref:glycosyltransferase family 9 protein n=1 Tax=Streptomyces sp. B6B3 TaxID=3153570 RepID=UPI00325CFB0B